MKTKTLFILGCLLLPAAAFAYGPRSVTAAGDPVKWDLPVALNMECNLDVRGKDATLLVDEGLSRWVDLEESDVTFTEETLGVDVDADNVCCYLYDPSICPQAPVDDGLNPIVIDDDGAVVAKFFGSANRYTTLGFAAVISHNPVTGQAIKGEAVFNAACLQGIELEGCTTGGFSFTDDDFISFVVHEIGHFLGLNHTQVNLTEAADDDASNDDKITTMYPLFTPGNGANFKTPERDDAVGLAFLYPSGSFSTSRFSVTGTVFDEDGTTEFACANVVARNSGAGLSRTDAVSFVSGQLCPDGSFNGSCDGNYEIRGLDPAQSYTVEVELIKSAFVGASGIPPCDGSGERPTFDAQTYGSSVTGTAGQATAGVDFTLTNTSRNVNSLTLPALDSSGALLDNDPSIATEAILEIERKTATDDCPTSRPTTCSSSTVETDGDGGGGGCSLIP